MEEGKGQDTPATSPHPRLPFSQRNSVLLQAIPKFGGALRHDLLEMTTHAVPVLVHHTQWCAVNCICC